MANSFDNELETPELETLASLAENLIYRLPGCDDIMVRKTLQEVYRDFCRRSCCLCGRRHFTISYEDPDIYVAPIFGGVIDSVAEIRYNGRILGPHDYIEHGNRIAFKNALIPYEGCDESDLPDIVVLTIEMPKLNGEQIPSFLVQRYGDALCCGVLARLQAIGGKPWYDAPESGTNRIQYENALNEARVRYCAGSTSGRFDYVGDPCELI